MTRNGRAGSSPAHGTNINNFKFNKIMDIKLMLETKDKLIDVRNKIAQNAYSTYDINFDEKQVIFYYNCEDNAILALIKASKLSNKIIYEKIYTWREQYKLTICF